MNGYLRDHKKFLVALFLYDVHLVNKFDFDFELLFCCVKGQHRWCHYPGVWVG
jgi:hypothetical protein